MKSLLALRPYILRYRWSFVFGILFVFLANWFSVRVPVYVGEAINQITARAGLMEELFNFGVLILALAGLGGAFRYLMRRVLIDRSRDIEYDFRNDLYAHLQALDAGFYDRNSTGDIMSRMTNDIDQVRMMLGPAIMYTANTVFTVPLVLWAMLKLDWRLTLAGLAPLVFLPFLVKVFGRILYKRSRAEQDQLGDLTTFVQESISGIRVLKAYGQEGTALDRFATQNDLFTEKAYALARSQSWFIPWIRGISGIGLVAILYVGSVRMVAGETGVGTLLSIVMLFAMLIWPLIAAGWVLNIFQRAAAAMDRLNGIRLAASRIADGPGVVPVDKLPATLDIEFRNFTFAYNEDAAPVLRDINLVVPAGSTLGIVGRVGSGKSTLVHLLLRMYPVARGQLFLGGVDINDWPLDELRRRVSIVFQETFLFSDTIAENIRFGSPEHRPGDAVVEAATRAGVHDDITEFPNGYETLLGERGINLSGGQKQRTSLARALLRDASVMILDDSLSAVDTHTEETILGSLRTMMEGRTTFLISHRISTVAMADQVIVLEDGTISQRGRHEELVAQPGLYAELHRKQLLEEEVEAIG